MICRECGVEFDNNKDECPLCGMHVTGNRAKERLIGPRAETPAPRAKNVLQQILWQITSVLLISCIASTLIIDLSMKGVVTWSIYPVTVCVILLAYVVLLSLRQTHPFVRVSAGWGISTLLLVILDRFLFADWPMSLAFPILSSVNVFLLLLLFITRLVKKKSLNLVALIFFSIALLCIFIDGIVSMYLTSEISLSWSAIVVACLLPVTGAILFMHFRMKNNAELEKIFHT